MQYLAFREEKSLLVCRKGGLGCSVGTGWDRVCMYKDSPTVYRYTLVASSSRITSVSMEVIGKVVNINLISRLM